MPGVGQGRLLHVECRLHVQELPEGVWPVRESAAGRWRRRRIVRGQASQGRGLRQVGREWAVRRCGHVPKMPCHATGLPFAPSPFTPPLASLFPGIGRPLPKLLVVAPSQPTPSTWRTSAGARATSARTSAETCCQTVTRGSATHSARATGASWRSTASERAAGAGPRGRSRRRACAPTRTSSARTGLSWASVRRTRSSWGASARAPATLARGAALQARALAAGPRAQLRLRPRLRRRFRAWTTIGGARRGRPRAGASPTRVSCGRRAPWRVGHAIITHSLLRGGVPLRCRGRGGDARTRPWRAAIARRWRGAMPTPAQAHSWSPTAAQRAGGA